MPDQPAVPKSKVRLARLDGLRGATPMGVVVHHIGYFHQQAMSTLPHGTDHLLSWFSVSGWTLVDLFFVLSGYVFSHVYGAPGQLRQPGALADFWVARFTRLWPLHVVVTLAVALFAWGGINDTRHLLLHLGLLQGLAVGAPLSFNVVSWSVSIELMAYAVFSAGAMAGDRVLLWISWLAVSGSVWWLVVVGCSGGPWLGDVIPRGLLGFFFGQLLWRGRAWLEHWPWPMLAAALVCGFWLQTGRYSPLVPMGLLGWPATVLLALRIPLLERGAMAWLGERSYGIYMVHLPISRALDSIMASNTLGWPGFVAQQAVFMVLSLAAADLAFRLIEMPARRALRAAWAARHVAPLAVFA